MKALFAYVLKQDWQHIFQYSPVTSDKTNTSMLMDVTPICLILYLMWQTFADESLLAISSFLPFFCYFFLSYSLQLDDSKHPIYAGSMKNTIDWLYSTSSKSNKVLQNNSSYLRYMSWRMRKHIFILVWSIHI